MNVHQNRYLGGTVPPNLKSYVSSENFRPETLSIAESQRNTNSNLTIVLNDNHVQ